MKAIKKILLYVTKAELIISALAFVVMVVCYFLSVVNRNFIRASMPWTEELAVLLVPVLWPMAKTMGIHPIHFGMIVCISNVIGTMTPPVAVNIFSAVQVTRSVRELKIGSIAKAEMPYFIGYTAVFFLCVFSEWFCTFLIK